MGFGLGQSSICLKDQLTILRLGLIKHLSERSVDNTSARKKFQNIFYEKNIFFREKYFFVKKNIFAKIYGKKYFMKKYLFEGKIFFCEKKYFRQNLRKKIFHEKIFV